MLFVLEIWLMCSSLVVPEYPMKGVTSHLSEELLFIFPVINLLVSPSKSVKAAASYLLILVERLVAELSVEPNKFSKSSSQFQHASKLESITFRLLNHLWFQVVIDLLLL